MKFVIVKSVFGEYWIGKTELELPKQAKGFDNFEDALEEALSLNDSIENDLVLKDTDEENIEEIVSENMFKWLV